MSNESSFAASTHAMADIQPGVRIHYVTAGEGGRTIVFLHGFPQTRWEWRLVMPALVQAGFGVIALDYRGAGQSWRRFSKPLRISARACIATAQRMTASVVDGEDLVEWVPQAAGSVVTAHYKHQPTTSSRDVS